MRLTFVPSHLVEFLYEEKRLRMFPHSHERDDPLVFAFGIEREVLPFAKNSREQPLCDLTDGNVRSSLRGYAQDVIEEFFKAQMREKLA